MTPKIVEIHRQLAIEFRGEMIFFSNIIDALDHAYRKGRHEGYGEGYNDTKLRLQEEHKLLLDELKLQFNATGKLHLADLIHKIDPEWKSRWDLTHERYIANTYCYECGRQARECICV